jgi:hypothetical protein
MAQIGMFPLSLDELKAMGKELASKVKAYNQTEADKDLANRQYNEQLKRLRGEMTQLAEVLETEQVARQATDDEAPWQGVMDEAETILHQGRLRRRTTRDRTGEVLERPEDDAPCGRRARPWDFPPTCRLRTGCGPMSARIRVVTWRRRPPGYLAVFSTFARLRPRTPAASLPEQSG